MLQKILLAVTLDTSASMADQADAYRSSMQEYFAGLKQDPNAEYYLLLTEFDTTARVVVKGVPLKNYEFKTYNPHGGSTNLYDALFVTADAADQWLRNEAKRGNTYKIIWAIETDGEHNHQVNKKKYGVRVFDSRDCEHDREDVAAKIAEKEATGYWTIAYLASNQNAWAVAGLMGMASGMSYMPSAAGIKSGMDTLLERTMSYSSRGAQGLSTNTKEFWTDDGSKPVDVTSDVAPIQKK